MTRHQTRTRSARSSVRSGRQRNSPSQANYSDDLCTMVISDTKRIVDQITARAAVEPYEVLEHAERHLLFEHRRAQQIASAADDRFGCKALAQDLDAAILELSDVGKRQCGFRAVQDACRIQLSHSRRNGMPKGSIISGPRDIVGSGLPSTSRASLRKRRMNGTRRSSGALRRSRTTWRVPAFRRFLVLLARQKPQIAERFILRANGDLLNFLMPF